MALLYFLIATGIAVYLDASRRGRRIHIHTNNKLTTIMSEIKDYVTRQNARFERIEQHLAGIGRDVQEFKELIKQLRRSNGLSAEDRVLLGGLETKAENLANKIAAFDDADPDGSVPEDNASDGTGEGSAPQPTNEEVPVPNPSVPDSGSVIPGEVPAQTGGENPGPVTPQNPVPVPPAEEPAPVVDPPVEESQAPADEEAPADTSGVVEQPQDSASGDGDDEPTELPDEAGEKGAEGTASGQ